MAHETEPYSQFYFDFRLIGVSPIYGDKKKIKILQLRTRIKLFTIYKKKQKSYFKSCMDA